VRWPEAPLGELVTLGRGFDLPSTRRRPGEVPVVSSRGVIDQHDRARAGAPGVVIGRTGTIGGAWLLERPFWPLNTTLYVRDFRGNDPAWVAHLLRALDLAALDDKAAVPGVSRDALARLRVPVPPVRQQRRIARALAPFERRADALLDLDARLARIGLAEYARLRQVRAAPVEELCRTIANGGTPPRGDTDCWEGGTIPWVRSGELDDGPVVAAGERITPRALERSVCRVFPRGTVLLAIYAAPTLGRLGILDRRAAANQACCALVARREWGAAFLYHALLASRDRLAALATGAAQQNLRQAQVRAHEVAVPDRDDARAFHERAMPLLLQRAAYRREIAAIARLRDGLRARWLFTSPGRAPA